MKFEVYGCGEHLVSEQCGGARSRRTSLFDAIGSISMVNCTRYLFIDSTTANVLKARSNDILE
jgi:hypothetical protein